MSNMGPQGARSFGVDPSLKTWLLKDRFGEVHEQF